MLLPGCHIVRTCLFFTVLIAAVKSYPYPEDEKSFNIKIGFDITQGENGAPALLVRDFEDSKELNPRAADSASRKSDEDQDKNYERKSIAAKYHDDALGKKVFRKAKIPLRAVSSKSSESSIEDAPNAKDKRSSDEAKSNEGRGGGKSPQPPSPPEPDHSKSDDDNDEDADSDVDSKHSTRGLGAEEYEPEEKNPRVHVRDDDDDDDEGRRRRSKRAADIFMKYYNESKLKRKHKKALQVSLKPRRTTHTPYVF